MAQTAAKAIVLGFLTVRSTECGGLRGGYLLATDYGRPVEFHYTDLVFVSPEQRILWGRDFESNLYPESFGKPLTDRQRTAPRILFVEQLGMMALRRTIPAPVLLVSSHNEGAEPVETASATLECHPDFPADQAAFAKLSSLLPTGINVREPFDRISRALDEIERRESSTNSKRREPESA